MSACRARGARSRNGRWVGDSGARTRCLFTPPLSVTFLGNGARQEQRPRLPPGPEAPPCLYSLARPWGLRPGCAAVTRRDGHSVGRTDCVSNDGAAGGSVASAVTVESACEGGGLRACLATVVGICHRRWRSLGLLFRQIMDLRLQYKHNFDVLCKRLLHLSLQSRDYILLLALRMGMFR